MTIIYIAIILLVILLEGFFSGSEIAIISLNRIRLRILAEDKEEKALLLHKMLKDPNRLLGTTLVGTNLAVVVASSLCASLVYDVYGISSEWLTTLILSPVVLIFGEFIPKAIFSQVEYKTTFRLGSFLKFFWRLFYPFVWVINKFVNLILRGFTGGSSPKGKSPFVTIEEIKYLVKESESVGEIDTYERSIIYKIFDFGKKKTKDIMRELKELVYLKDCDSIEGLIKKAAESGYSRFPIRSNTGEFLGIVNILGVVYKKDRTLPLSKFLRPICYVDANMDIDNALFLLQSKKQNLAIVKDPQGAPIGFFTMEDLLEELIGEIE